MSTQHVSTEGAMQIRDDRLAVLMEEYRALRAESLAALAMQQTVISFSTIAIGGLAIAGLQTADNGTRGLIFFLATPLVSFVSLFLWLGEFARTARAGYFIATEIEPRANGLLPSRMLTWECWLREPGDRRPAQFTWNTWAVFLFYLAVPVVSVVVANFAVELSTASLVAFDVVAGACWLGAFWFLFHEFSLASTNAKAPADEASKGATSDAGSQ